MLKVEMSPGVEAPMMTQGPRRVTFITFSKVSCGWNLPPSVLSTFYFRDHMPPKPSRRPLISSIKPSLPTSPSPPSRPSPFHPAPTSLQPFLSTLSPSHIYITHVDTHPSAFKRRIFLVPILLNVFLVLALLYRAYIALPTYLNIITATLGYDNSTKIPVKEIPWGALAGTLVGRAGLFMFDYFLATIILPWPLDFFLGSASNPTGPVAWRWRCGFRDKEIVVRRSRRWEESLQGTDWTGAEAIERDEERVMSERIAPAVAERWIRGKTGYLMMDKSWDLDFGAMVAAHELVTGGTLTLEDFRTQVLVYREGEGWVVLVVERGERDERTLEP